MESARQFAGKAAYSEQGGLTRHKTNRLGDTMIQSKLAALALIAGPAQAGTCVPVTVRGRDLASATTQASVKVTRRAAGIGGKIKNSSSNCQKGWPGGFVGLRLPEGGDAMVTCTKLGLWPIRTNQFHGHVIRGFRDT